MFREDKIKEIEEAKKKYNEEVVSSVLKKNPEIAPRFTTISNQEIDRLYTPDNASALDYLKDLGFPGVYPFTRGLHPTGYRGKHWTRRQVCGYGTAEETNERVKFLASQGQTGFSVVFDHPTNTNVDSDDELAEGFIGKEGTAIDTIQDMRDLFKDIEIKGASINLITASPSLLAMFIAVAEEKGIPLCELRGTIQNDVLSGTYHRNIDIHLSMRVAVDVIEYCGRHMPLWHPVSIAVRNTRDAGCSAIQEMAFGLASAIAYTEWTLKRGIEIDQFAPRISFFLNAHNDFFEEVAKYRAMRRMYARLMKERFGAKDPRSTMMKFHVQTSGDSLTAQQPYNNIVRASLQGLAAIMGGAQSLHINSFDEAYAIPTADAATLSLRTQQIILYESGVANTIDPLGGSYFVETLTNKMEEEAWALIEKIEKLGGMVEACNSGWIQSQVADSAWEYQKQVEKKEKFIVGVNLFVSEEKPQFDVFELDPYFANKQIDRVTKFKRERDQKQFQGAYEHLVQVCMSEENTMPATIEAVKAYATVGEIGKIYQEASAAKLKASKGGK